MREKLLIIPKKLPQNPPWAHAAGAVRICYERNVNNSGRNRAGFKKAAVRAFFHNLFDIRDDMMGYDGLHQMMEENTVIRGSDMWTLIMAILIASLGLNVNSTAVIIGAMLISPLMSSILTHFTA